MEYYEICENAMTCNGMSWNTIECRGISQDFMEHQGIWSNGIQWNVMEYFEMLWSESRLDAQNATEKKLGLLQMLQNVARCLTSAKRDWSVLPSSHIMDYHGVLENTMTHLRILWNIENHEITWDILKCPSTSRNTESSKNIVEYNRIS